MWEAFLQGNSVFYSSCRRVHITKTTLDYLDDKFEVEPGNGSAREQYLADHKVETYLIVPPKVWNNEACGTFSLLTLLPHFLREYKSPRLHQNNLELCSSGVSGISKVLIMDSNK